MPGNRRRDYERANMAVKHRRIATETWIILIVGMLDLATTLIWVGMHGASEANPIFQTYLDHGVAGFIIAKLACLLGPLYILEVARRRRPQFTLWASRLAIACYVLFYAVGVARLNPQVFRTNHTQMATIGPLDSIRDEYVERATQMITHHGRDAK